MDASPSEASRAAFMLHFFWRARSAAVEEQERLHALLNQADLPRQSRASLLVRLSDVEMHFGRVDDAGAMAQEALRLAEPRTEPHWLAVTELAFDAQHRGDADEAVRLGQEALAEAETLDDTLRIQAIGLLATILLDAKRADEARPLYERVVHEARSSDLPSLETIGLADLGRLDLLEHDFESAHTAYAAALTQLRGRGNDHYEPEILRGLGLASLGLGRHAEARAWFAEMLELTLAAGATYSRYLAQALSGIALAADSADARRGLRLRIAVSQLNRDSDVAMNAYSAEEEELERQFEQQLLGATEDEAWEPEKAAGSTMTLEEAIALARSLCRDSANAAADSPTDPR